MKRNPERMKQLSPYFFARLSQRLAEMKAQGRDVIRLDEGSPDMPPAAHIIKALNESAIHSDHHGYQSHRGTPDLRQAWVGLYQRLYGINLDPDQHIIPLLGSKEGIFHLSLAMLNPSDIVLVPDPGYITYTRGALFVGADVYRMPLLKENGFLPDLQAIPSEVINKTSLMWLNYPNNPTASLADQSFFDQVIVFAKQNDILVCHDAAYTQVTYNGQPAPSLLSSPGALDVALEFNSLSKSHNMAGWRTAAALGNPDALQALFSLKTNADSSLFRPIIDASIAALEGDQNWIQERNAIYRQRSDLVVASLLQMGIKADLPSASMYVWASVPQGWKSMDFAAQLLEKTGVSLTPGVVFGEYGEGYMRIALTASIERAQVAMDRMGEWMGSWH
jgi:LL-diaminopimelate aminotransferase